MALFPSGITLFAADLLGLINPVLVRSRAIGGFVADITVEENHTDQLVITEHPVEQGAPVADHAYMRPSSVTIRVGYSNSSQRANGNLNYVEDIYQGFLAMQAAREPIDVLTGKRAYKNMAITSLTTSTSDREATENAMMLTVECRELILVNTQTVTVPQAGVMKSPQITGATQNTGAKSLLPGTAFNPGPFQSAFAA